MEYKYSEKGRFKEEIHFLKMFYFCLLYIDLDRKFWIVRFKEEIHFLEFFLINLYCLNKLKEEITYYIYLI